MSRPINPDSTISRVLLCLHAGPRTTTDIAAQLQLTEPCSAWKVSRAVWHLRQRGVVRLASRHPVCLYRLGMEPGTPLGDAGVKGAVGFRPPCERACINQMQSDKQKGNPVSANQSAGKVQPVDMHEKKDLDMGSRRYGADALLAMQAAAKTLPRLTNPMETA